MLPLRLVRLDMADDASDTLGGGIRNWLGMIGLAAVLGGSEEAIRTGPKWWHLALILIGLPIPIAMAMDNYLRPIQER